MGGVLFQKSDFVLKKQIFCQNMKKSLKLSLTNMFSLTNKSKKTPKHYKNRTKTPKNQQKQKLYKTQIEKKDKKKTHTQKSNISTQKILRINTSSQQTYKL